MVDDELRELMANELERLENSRPPYFDQLEHLEGTDSQWYREWLSFEMLADLYLDGGVSSETAIRILNYWQQPDLASAPPLQLDHSPEQAHLGEQLKLDWARLIATRPDHSDPPTEELVRWWAERDRIDKMKSQYLPSIVRLRISKPLTQPPTTT